MLTRVVAFANSLFLRWGSLVGRCAAKKEHDCSVWGKFESTDNCPRSPRRKLRGRRREIAIWGKWIRFLTLFARKKVLLLQYYTHWGTSSTEIPGRVVFCAPVHQVWPRKIKSKKANYIWLCFRGLLNHFVSIRFSLFSGSLLSVFLLDTWPFYIKIIWSYLFLYIQLFLAFSSPSASSGLLAANLSAINFTIPKREGHSFLLDMAVKVVKVWIEHCLVLPPPFLANISFCFFTSRYVFVIVKYTIDVSFLANLAPSG